MPTTIVQPIHHSQHSDDDHHLSADEITTFNCQSDKKISSRYTQLRKQLRSCEHFKENYFVLEVNKPTGKTSNENHNGTTEKRKRKKKQSDQTSHPDESLSNDGSEEMKKKKRKKTSPQPETTESSLTINTSSTTNTNTPSPTTSQTTTTTTCVNNEQQPISSTNTTTSPQLNDGLVLQLMGLLQNNGQNNTTNPNCNNLTLEGLELQIKLLQRLQETINLLKGSSPQISIPAQEQCFNNISSIASIAPPEDMYQQILDFGDCCTENQSFPIEMAGVASCEDFSELLNSFI